MNIDDMPLMAMIQQRMSWLSARQNVLAQNVANADTPGFTARDLKPINFEDILKGTTSPADAQSGTSVTDPRHISLTQPGGPSLTDYSAPDGEDSPSGNSVSLEQEMIKVADTQAEYQAASNLYAKAIDMMKLAIGR
jgi:flagellar basal-body rod protein FlgB